MMNFLRLFSMTLSIAAAFVFVQTAQAQTAGAPPTATYRSDLGHSGYSPTTAPAVLSVSWQTSLPDVKVAYSTPALVGGVLYFGAGKHVYAVNEKDGAIKWQYPADGTAATGEFNCPPAVADGKVFIGSEDKNLSVFDASSGALLWTVPTQGAVESSPTIDNGTVFFGCNDGNIYAIKEADQKPLWGGQFRCDGPVFSSPIVTDGTIFFSDANSNLYAIKESTGEKVWTYLPSGGVTPGGPVFRNGVFYVVSGRNILSLSPRTGAVNAFYNLPTNVLGSVTVSDNHIFASGSDQQIYCMNLHGSIQWHTRLHDISTVPLVVTDSYLYATSRRGVIYALDPTNGTVVWNYALQDSVIHPLDASKVTKATLPQTRTNSSPLLQDGKLFVVTNDGSLTAFSGTAPDHVAPVVLSETPQPDSTVGGADIQFQAFVTDVGSGLNPDSVSLRVDGYPIPVYYDPSYSQVAVQFDHTAGTLGISRIILPTLPDGLRTATLKIADWRGNVVTKTWSFTVDNTKNPAGSPAATPLPDNPTGVNPGGPMIPAGGQTTTGGGRTNSGGGANGGGNNGGGNNGGGVVVNPGVPNPGGYTPEHPAPAPPPGTQGGGANGGVGFPPPPPI